MPTRKILSLFKTRITLYEVGSSNWGQFWHPLKVADKTVWTRFSQVPRRVPILKWHQALLLSEDDIVGEEDRVLSNREESGAAVVSGTKRETPVKCLKGIRACSSKKVTVAQLKFPYTNAHSMVNKLDESEITVQLESWCLIIVTETWWNEPHDGHCSWWLLTV